jgi:hypothetical protein
VQSLIKVAQGINDRHSFADIKQQLRTHTALFISAFRFQTTDGKPSYPPHVALMQSTPLRVQQLENGVVVHVDTTLSGALSELVSSVQVVQELPVANCTMGSRFVFYIVANFDVFEVSLRRSLHLRYEDYENKFSVYSSLVREESKQSCRLVVGDW